jgi:hypothetical protein
MTGWAGVAFSVGDLRALSSAYELNPSDVLIDARLVEHWQAPPVELYAELMRRHHWASGVAQIYAAQLRGAVQTR